MRSTPLRRPGGQTLFVDDAVGGDISPRTAWPKPPPGAPFVRRTTLQPTTAGPPRDAEWGEATSARTGQPSVPTVGGLTGRGRMPASTREGPASPPGCGNHHPHHAGSGGLRETRGFPRAMLPRQRPRPPRGRRVWAGGGRREDRAQPGGHRGVEGRRF